MLAAKQALPMLQRAMPEEAGHMRHAGTVTRVMAMNSMANDTSRVCG